MSNIKKFFISFLTLIFAAFTTSLNIFAAQPQLPDGFEKLSVEQRIQWMDENLKQTTEYATSMINTRNIVRDYTSTKDNYYTSGGSRVVGIVVTYNWRVNLDGTIEHYSISQFDPIIYNGYYSFIDKSTTSYYVNNINVKICPEATFASAYEGVLVGQNTNLHGSGAISFSGISQSY